MDFLGQAIAGFAPALFWLWWVRSHDRAAPEPLRVVLATFGLGALSTALVLLARPPLEDLLPSGRGLDRALADAFLVTAPLEEFAKALALLYALFHRELDERLDGVVYGAAAGLGFASIENIVYVLREADPSLAFVRGFTSTALHLGTTGALGFLLACAKLTRHRGRRVVLALVALPAAALLHGAYDLFLLVEGDLAWVSLLGVLPLILVVVAMKVRWAKRDATQRSSSSRPPTRSTRSTAPSGPISTDLGSP